MIRASRIAGSWQFACLLCALVAAPAMGQAPDERAGQATGALKTNSTYEELYQRYLESARAMETGPEASMRWMVGLTGDPRAHRLNDLVTVKVVESITATGKADSSITKSTAASAGIPNLLSLENKVGSLDMSKLAAVSSDSKFSGAGATTREGDLTAVMTARVAEVLPNGDLVLEGVREIDINGDRQLVVLTGVVRPLDIGSNNSVLSTQIGQLSIRYFGNGLIKDSLKPGILARLLNKVF